MHPGFNYGAWQSTRRCKATVSARCPVEADAPGVQLRGMAVDKTLQSHGVGALLLSAGIERARGLGAHNVWARARDTALAFYERNGMHVVGDAFLDDATGMSHHLVVMDVR